MEKNCIIITSSFALVLGTLGYYATRNYLRERNARLLKAQKSFETNRPLAIEALTSLGYGEKEANNYCDLAQDLILKRAKRKNGGSGLSLGNKWIVIVDEKLCFYDLAKESIEKDLDNIYDVKEVVLILKDIL